MYVGLGFYKMGEQMNGGVVVTKKPMIPLAGFGANSDNQAGLMYMNDGKWTNLLTESN